MYSIKFPSKHWEGYKAILKELNPHLLGGRVENLFGNTTLSKPDRDLNLNLLVIGSLVYRKSSALAHTVSKTGSVPEFARKESGKLLLKKPTLVHPTEIRTSISLSSAVLSTCESVALGHTATEAGIRKVIFRGSVPTFTWNESGKSFGKKTTSVQPTEIRNSISSSFGSLIYRESSALNHAATGILLILSIALKASTDELVEPLHEEEPQKFHLFDIEDEHPNITDPQTERKIRQAPSLFGSFMSNLGSFLSDSGHTRPPRANVLRAQRGTRQHLRQSPPLNNFQGIPGNMGFFGVKPAGVPFNSFALGPSYQEGLRSVRSNNVFLGNGFPKQQFIQQYKNALLAPQLAAQNPFPHLTVKPLQFPDVNGDSAVSQIISNQLIQNGFPNPPYQDPIYTSATEQNQVSSVKPWGQEPKDYRYVTHWTYPGQDQVGKPPLSYQNFESPSKTQQTPWEPHRGFQSAQLTSNEQPKYSQAEYQTQWLLSPNSETTPRKPEIIESSSKSQYSSLNSDSEAGKSPRHLSFHDSRATTTRFVPSVAESESREISGPNSFNLASYRADSSALSSEPAIRLIEAPSLAPKSAATSTLSKSAIPTTETKKKATLKDILIQDCADAEKIGYCASPPRYPSQQITVSIKQCEQLLVSMYAPIPESEEEFQQITERSDDHLDDEDVVDVISKKEDTDLDAAVFNSTKDMERGNRQVGLVVPNCSLRVIALVAPLRGNSHKRGFRTPCDGVSGVDKCSAIWFSKWNQVWSWAHYGKDGSEPSKPPTVCQSSSKMIEPGYARDTITGRWLVVVQSNGLLTQRVAVDICTSVEKPCLGMTGSKCSQRGSGFRNAAKKSRCVQKYSYQHLITWDPDTPELCPRIRVFRFPTACVCHLGGA
uniref:Spaetzle domain-containing protein n=1 Tax=Timema bartmani TaxID=61472 RepID=A0A7R9EXV5_9NEOP|nr:unnamed protein product [Timema bartmani]